MNHNEAIRILRNEIRCCMRHGTCNGDCEHCDLVYDTIGTYENSEPILEALQIAIEAVRETEVTKVLETEFKCVTNGNTCGRDCAHCELAFETTEPLLNAYGVAIEAIKNAYIH